MINSHIYTVHTAHIRMPKYDYYTLDGMSMMCVCECVFLKVTYYEMRETPPVANHTSRNSSFLLLLLLLVLFFSNPFACSMSL